MMKFGQNFHLFQVPEWEAFYVNYDLLKMLFSTVAKKDSHPGRQPNFTELYSCLFSSINVFETFRNNQYELLHRKEQEFRKIYGIDFFVSEFSALEKMDDCEAKDFLTMFIELREDFRRLQWYARVNQDAISRIYSKLERFSQAIGPTHHEHKSKLSNLQLHWDTKCLKDATRLDKIVDGIKQARQKEQSSSACRSLYLKSICDLYSPVLQYPSEEYQAIRDDRPSDLVKMLQQMIPWTESPNSQLKTLFCGLLAYSMMCQSRKCTAILLSTIDGGFIGGDSFNHLITIMGRRNKTKDCLRSDSRAQKLEHQNDNNMGTNQLLQLLEQLGSRQVVILQTNDTFGRFPLHYAALYGMTTICQSILDSLHTFEQDSAVVNEAILSTDFEGHTPIYFGVIGNYVEVTRLFLEALEMDHGTDDENLRNILDELFFLAVKSQYDGIVELLASSHINIKYRSSRGETALYVAAQLGREDYVKIILSATSYQDAIDNYELAKGWTPLFISCSNGHVGVVKLLLQAGASQTILDHLGWTAKEHATFKGHLYVASMLDDCSTVDSVGGPASTVFRTEVSSKTRLLHGHDYIIVNLGVMQKGMQVTAVNLNCCSSEYTRGLHTDSRFAIEISARGGNGPSFRVQLPILDDKINDPFIFPIKEHDEAQLVFNIFCSTPTNESKGILIGSGTALLGNYNNCFGAQRESLIRVCTTPILEKETLCFMGTVTFTFTIAKPCVHLATSRLSDYPIKTSNQIQLVGHRGLGQNTADREHLQLGENTVESFLSAVKLGASFVEFDVQLTRDLVPIIYHDFSLSESGTDIPIHDLTLKQFIYASKVQSPRGDPVSVFGRPSPPEQGKHRSRSVTRDQERGAMDVQDRMRLTVDFTNKGFKPNTRGCSIQDSFTTLEELLVDMPMPISFNVEIKYPRLHEAIDAGVAPVAIELNTFVDATLEKIYRFGGDRTIILSSFTPDVCILLSVKQQLYPVMLITNAGKLPMADMEMRGGSLQVAVRFAKRWNLAGVVFASEALLLCPRLIKYVKNAGLSCASYGLVNNIPENAKALAEAGLDMIMADRVGLIAKCLNMHPYQSTVVD